MRGKRLRDSRAKRKGCCRDGKKGIKCRSGMGGVWTYGNREPRIDEAGSRFDGVCSRLMRKWGVLCVWCTSGEGKICRFRQSPQWEIRTTKKGARLGQQSYRLIDACCPTEQRGQPAFLPEDCDGVNFWVVDCVDVTKGEGEKWRGRNRREGRENGWEGEREEERRPTPTPH